MRTFDKATQFQFKYSIVFTSRIQCRGTSSLALLINCFDTLILFKFIISKISRETKIQIKTTFLQSQKISIQ